MRRVISSRFDPMNAASFLDTNILLYAYDLDAPAKRSVALELVEAGWSRLVGTDAAAIAAALADPPRAAERPELYGDGHAAERIAEHLGTMGRR